MILRKRSCLLFVMAMVAAANCSVAQDWHLTIPVSGALTVPSGEVYTPSVVVASFADATATVTAMELDDVDNSNGAGRDYDCAAIFNTTSTMDRFTHAAMVGAAQIGRNSTYPALMNFFARYDFNTSVYQMSTPGVGSVPIYDQSILNFGTPNALYARCWFNRGDGNSGPDISQIQILATIQSTTMPGAWIQSATLAGNTVTVNWTVSPANEASSQNLYRAASTNGPWTLLQTFNDNSTAQFSDTTTPIAVYFYKVVAQAGGIPGADSNVFSSPPPPPAPTVTALSFAPGATLGAAPASIAVTLSEPVDPATVNANSVQIIRAGPDGIFLTADDIQIVPNTVTTSGNSITADLSGLKLPNDQYRLILTSAAVPPSANLEAYYKFDEASGTSVADYSGFGNNGALLGGTSRAAGIAGNGVFFDGVTGQMKVPRNTELEPVTAITVSLWGKITDPLSGGVGDLIRKAGPFQAGYLLRWSSANGHLEWHIDNNDGSFLHIQNPVPNTAYLNAWHHFAATYDGASGVSSLYVDGVLAVSASGGHATLDHTDDLYLSFVQYGSQIGVPGTLDEFRVYSRALSPAEIAELATRGIEDANTTALDGEFNGTFPSGDGNPGGDFVASFTVSAPLPVVTAMTPTPGSTLTQAPASITATFNVAVAPATVNTTTVKLVGAGPDGVIGTADDVTVLPHAISANGNSIMLDLTGVRLPNDQYQLTLSGGSLPVLNAAAYWKFDETSGTAAADSSGNGNNGTLTGTPNWVPGIVGGALNFSSSNFVTVNNSALGNFDSSDFSVAFWIKTMANNCQLIGNRYAQGNAAFWTVKLSNPGTIDLEIDQDGVGTNYNNTGTATKAVNDGAWHHVAVLRSAATLSVYVDGVLDVTTTGPGTANVSNGGATLIGANIYDGEQQHFAGTLDEVRIFTRVLTQAEIQRLINAPLAITDIYGNILDGEFNDTFPSGDGKPGGDFLSTFTINAPLPVVTAITPTPGSTLAQPPATIMATLNKNIDPASVNSSSVRLIRAGPDGILGTSDDVTLVPAAVNVINGNQIQLDLNGVKIPDDQYQLTILGSGVGTGAGNALSFDGANQFCKTTQQWFKGTGNQGSIECWAKPVARGSGDMILHKAFWNDLLMWFDYPAGATQPTIGLKFPLDHGGTHAAPEVQLGQWYHFAGVYDGSNVILYINGVEKARWGFSGTVNWDGSFTASYIGGMDDPWGGKFPGTIDEVRIWNTARTPAQIQANMKQTLTGPQTGLLAYYKFDEGSGQLAKDSSGNGIDIALGANTAPGPDDPSWVVSNAPITSVVTDLSGNILDGEFGGTFPSGDGKAGGDFVATFNIATGLKLQVTAMTPASNSSLVSEPANIVVNFSENIDPTTATSGTVSLVRAGADGILGTVDDVVITPAAISFSGNNALLIDLSNVKLPNDLYQLRLSGNLAGAAITDANGNVLDGEFTGTFPTGDGIPGGDFVAAFTVNAPPLQVTALSLTPGSTLASVPTSIIATLSGSADPATISPGAVRLVRAGPDGLLGTSDDVIVTAEAVSVVNSSQIQIDLTGAKLPNDKYQFSLLSLGAPTALGLAAKWSFDEGSGTNAADSSGNGLNGTLVGSTWTPGIRGSALNFGPNAYVNIGAGNIAPPWTLGLWVKRQNSPNPSSDLMTSSSSYLKLEQYPGLKKVGFTQLGVADYAFNYTAPVGSWVHLTFIGTSTNTSLYVNGALQDAVGVSISLPMNTIGANSGNSVYGALDEIRVYNRALSAAEIQALPGGITDQSGNALDGEFSGTFPTGDGIPGGDFVARFNIATGIQPQVTAMTPAPNSSLVSQPANIVVIFGENIDPTTATSGTVSLVRAGADGILGTADDVVMTPAAISLSGNNTLLIDLSNVKLPNDLYQLRLSGNLTGTAITDANGNVLDGEFTGTFPTGDGKPGGDFVAAFTVNAPLPVVTAMTPTPGIMLAQAPALLTATLNKNVDPSSVNSGSVRLIRAGPDGLLGTADDVTVVPNSINVVNGNQIQLDLSGMNIPDDQYQLRLLGSGVGTGAGNALSFDGANQFCKTTQQWFRGTGNQGSVECWAKPVQPGAGDLILHKAFWNDLSMGFSYSNTATQGTINLTFPLDHGGTYTGPELQLGQWYHIAGVYDGSNVILYVNGVEKARWGFSGNVNWDGSFTASYLGGMDDPWGGKFPGLMDEVRIWSVARTPAQIQANMKQTLTGPQTGLLAYYKFDEGSGQLAKDSSGNGIDIALGATTDPGPDDPTWVASTAPITIAIMDLSGNVLDGEFSGKFPSGDGKPGGDFTATFTIHSPPAAQTGNFTTNEDTPASGILSATGTAALTYTIINNGTMGSAVVTNPSTGAFVYTPAANTTGTDTFTFKVNDGIFDSNLATVIVTIVQTAPVITSANSGNGTVGQPFNYAIVANHIPTGYSASGLPPGLLLDASTGVISGIPQLAGAFAATLNATNGAGTGSLAYTVDIAKGAPQLTWNNPADIVYGTRLGAVQLNAGAGAGVAGAFVYTPPAGTVLSAGVQILSVQFTPADSSAYLPASASVSINVQPAALSIVPQDQMKVYGSANPPLSANYSGFVNGDTAASLTTPIQLATAVTDGSAAGSYPIIASGASSPNYSIAYIAGALTVQPAMLSISADDQTRVFGAENPPLTASYSGFVNGDTVASLSTSVTLSTIASATSPAGTYPIVAAGAASANYTIVYSPGALTVTQGVAPSITRLLIVSATQGQSFSYTITATGTAPIVFAATGLPEGFSLQGDTLLGKSALSGAAAIGISASNAFGMDSETILLVIAPAAGAAVPPLAFVSLPSATLPLPAGNPVTLTATGQSGSLLVYSWDFGDGTTGTGATASHIYSAPGIYTATVTIGNGTSTATESVLVPVNAAEADTGGGGPLPSAFAVGKAGIKLNFARSSATLSIVGSVAVSKDFKPLGQSVSVAFGTLSHSGVLDSKGRTTDKFFALTPQLKPGTATLKFQVKLSDRPLLASLESFGFANANIVKPGIAVQLPVILSLDGTYYENTIKFTYTAKKGKSGSAGK